MEKYIGKKLDGRYEIIELIGVGGMADIYKAVDVVEDRVVAVKILKNEFSSSEDFRRRFRNESKAIALLSHPNIVKIYDVGLSEKMQYLVMEYIDGITLTEYIEKRRVLDWKDVVHFITQILRALQHAHDRGIVHRDIKPQNIMLLPDGTIKVMDFGIARFAREQGKTLSDKTIGSVHYISPEQARGDNTDERSDIYSVGVMMYEMLTGQKPFVGDNPVTIALMHMQSGCKRPSSINPDIPEGLENIIMRAMQKDSAKRYQSAALMIKDIDEFKHNPSAVFEYKYMTDPDEESTKYFDAVVPTKAGKKPAAQEDDYDEDDFDEDEYDEEDEEEEEHRSPLVPILAAVASVFVIIAAVVITMVIIKNFPTTSSDEILMPKLVGLNYLDAKKLYPDLDIQMETPEYSEYEEGIIIDQPIAEGRSVEKGTEVLVKVSKGLRMVNVPDVTNESKNNAFAILRGSEYDLNPVEQKTYDESVPAGYVIKTEPAANTSVEPGHTIVVYVSYGLPDESIRVPLFIGMTQEQAEAEAKDKLILNVEPTDSDKPKGEVINQDVNANSMVDRYTPVTIYVSTGVPAEKEATVNVRIPSGYSGDFEFSYYIDGILKDTTVINVALTDKWEIYPMGTGDAKQVRVMVKRNGSGEPAQEYAQYIVNFDDDPAPTYSEGFVNETLLQSAQTTTTPSYSSNWPSYDDTTTTTPQETDIWGQPVTTTTSWPF